MHQPKRIPHNFTNISGQKFGRLVVKSYAGVGSAGSLWHCLCACGAKTITNATKLRNGCTKSCGCHKADMARLLATHGETRNKKVSPEYRSWSAMKKRCQNPNDTAFKDYGGRGIKVCRKWTRSFAAFLKDMGRRPSPHHSIDRWPNNDGDYRPGNCRWATKKEQANNRRPAKRKK